MTKPPRAVAPLAVKCIIHLLVFAVFVWVLQAKLSLYKAHYSPTAATVAKASIEKRSAHAAALPEGTANFDHAWEDGPLATFVTLHEGISALPSRSSDIALSLCAPGRIDSKNTNLMRRPPPALS
jgi:hypothetical protein